MELLGDISFTPDRRNIRRKATNRCTILNLDRRRGTGWQTRRQDFWCGSDVSLLGSNVCYAVLCFPTAINPFFFGFSSANSSLVTPDASRATTPVEDVDTFDPSRPSLSPGDSILLPIGKIPSYLDTALKVLTLHTEARTSFITYAPCLLPPSPSPINLTKPNFFSRDHVDIGCRVYSNTNTSPCASSRSHRTKKQLGCASRPHLTSSTVSSCFSVESAQTMWDFGRRRLLARLRRTARRSGRMWSALMRRARPIALCSECWNGADWKSNEYVSHVRECGGFYLFFFIFPFPSGLCVGKWFTCSSSIREIVHLQ